MGNHLYLLTIGPVQSFIAQARKTQDLYAGSRILSRLVYSASIAFQKAFPEGEIIFPTGLKNTGKNASLPNRFVARISNHNIPNVELTHRAQQVESDIRDALEKVVKEVIIEAQRHKVLEDKLPKAFSSQIKEHLDIFWSFEVLNEGEENAFAETYEKLEQRIGAIKNIRVFSQFQYAEPDKDFLYAEDYGERGRKCSVDGIHNALFFRQAMEQEVPGNYFDLTSNAIPLNTFYLNPGEALSAVSFVKRFYPDTSKFPSTSKVALMFDENQIKDKPEEELLNCFKGLFATDERKFLEACFQATQKCAIEEVNLKGLKGLNQNFDYQYLFPENLNSRNFPNKEQLKLLQKVQQKLNASLKTRYYAIVHFDGDNMGKWLAGEYNKTKENLEEFHSVLSGALNVFGQRARHILDDDENRGHSIYIGGDDFLGFVNIYYLFDVMSELREAFDQTINESINRFKSNTTQTLTFSAGVVIAHFKTPFSEVLKQVRETEKKAKSIDDKNAFAITVLKHSGEKQEAVFKWGITDENLKFNWEAIARIINLIAVEAGENGQGAFSNTFIQNLTKEFTQLTGYDLAGINLKDQTGRFLDLALRQEIARLVSRSLKVFESPKKDSLRKQELTDLVTALWESAPSPKARNFIHARHIADFITRKTRQA